MRHHPVLPAQYTIYTACHGAHALAASQVGRTSSITLSQTVSAPRTSAAAGVPSPAEAQTTEGKDNNSKRDLEEGVVLVARESLADKVRDAAATAAASMVQATSPVARGLAVGGGGSSMEGRWDEEKFILPLPDGDDTFLAPGDGWDGARDGGDNPATEKDGGDGDCGAADGESSIVSIDEGVHLRVEIWQGRHCHGQVGCCFSIRGIWHWCR